MNAFINPPLPRHPALQPLSRDHYIGLVQARRLLEAANGNEAERRRALAGFLDAWHHEIAEHFDDEDRLLAPLATEPLRERLQQEHAELRAMAQEAQERRRRIDPDAYWMRLLGQTLNDHIRWEERELFPAIQERAGDQLDDLRDEADRLEASRRRGRA